MTRTHRAAIGAAAGVLFAITYVIGGKIAPGIVGGVLAAILLYVALGRFQEQHAANQARAKERRERKAGPRP